MLNGIDKLLTGDLLKILCDMGHGDELIIADANFPGERLAKRLIRLPAVDCGRVLDALLPLFPLDPYTEHPVAALDLTESDRASGVETPETWKEFSEKLEKATGDGELGKIERFDFYERAKNAFVVIQTGEERIYGDFLLVKGIVK